MARTGRRHPAWATLLALAAVAMAVLAVTGDSRSDALRARGVRVAGVVSHVDAGRTGPRQLVDFTTATGVREVAEIDTSSPVSVGDRVTVVYDPEHPDDAVLAQDLSSAAEDRAGAAGAAVALAAGSLLCAGWRLGRRRQTAASPTSA